HQEKWLQGKDGQYLLLPRGELRRWRDAGYSYGPMGLVATLDSSYYADPSKLWNALPPPQLSVVNNQLTIDPPSGFVGAFTVQATVTDGIASASRSFTVNVTDMAPVVASIADQVLRHGQAGTTLALNASDADGDPLTYAAQLRIDGLAGLAYQLDQQLNLTSDGNYYTNFQGNGEKWLQGNGGQYFILPDGQLRRWRNTTYSYGVAGLVGTLDPSYYADPSRLWNAQPLA